ncbi:MAG: glycosyltransferase family 2 protein, partial [Bacteroidetes bacterium]|nr:glycosyltransferase family 2 protein [Bacteroidota bacterium]
METQANIPPGNELKRQHDPRKAAPAETPAESLVQTTRLPASRTEFLPARRKEDDLPTPRETEHTFLKRIFVYGFLSLALFAIIYVFLNDPGGYLEGATGWTSTLRTSGLIVYSSIVALVLFLVILLFRYLSLMNMAYLNTTRHTVSNSHDHSFLPPISIIVPAYNEGILLQSTVSSLLEMDYPQYEIILVDDGSTDDTRERARDLVGWYRNGRVEVRLVEKSNGGKATALNAGIQVSRYDFLLNVDGDSQLSDNTLRKTIRHFVDPRLGAIAGNVKVLNRDNIWTTLQALEYVEGLNMARSAQSII